MRNILIITLAFIGFSFSQGNAYAQCKPKPVVKLHKDKMKPFSMDSYTENQVVFNGKPSKSEVQFTAFAGEQYRLVFCTDNVQGDVMVNIYDKTMKSKTKKELYHQTMNASNLVLPAFDTKKAGNYFIVFEVPAANDSVPASTEVKKSCVYTLIGYREEGE